MYRASRVRPHRVKPNRADHCHSGQDHTGSGYTGPSIQSIKGGPASIKHQGPSIQSSEHKIIKSIKSSKHQASRAFYTNHQSNKSSKHKIIRASSIRGLLCKASRVDPQADTLCIKASRAFYTIHQSIKSSKHQTSRAFYTKHQGWTRKLTPCAFRFSDLKVNIFRS